MFVKISKNIIIFINTSYGMFIVEGNIKILFTWLPWVMYSQTIVTYHSRK